MECVLVWFVCRHSTRSSRHGAATPEAEQTTRRHSAQDNSVGGYTEQRGAGLYTEQREAGLCTEQTYTSGGAD